MPFRAIGRGLIVFVAAIGVATAQPLPVPNPTNHGQPISTKQSERQPQQAASYHHNSSDQDPGSTSETPFYVTASCDHGCGYSESNESWWIRLATDPVATFTAVLAIFTLVLAIVGGWTGWLTRRSVRVAERALTDLERPHLFIENPAIDGLVANRMKHGIAPAMGPVMFEPTYDVLNYGRSPGIIIERSGSVYFGSDLPTIPNVNPNDVYTDPVVIPAAGSRKGWKALYRNVIDNEMVNSLMLTRSGAEPPHARLYLFVRLKYQSVYGTTDEVGAIWEYLIDIGKFVPCEIENYSYRKLGE